MVLRLNFIGCFVHDISGGQTNIRDISKQFLGLLAPFIFVFRFAGTPHTLSFNTSQGHFDPLDQGEN